MLRNTPEHWGLITRSLHWLIAAMILVQLPLGFLMVDAYDAWQAGHGDPALVMRLSQAHNTNGFLILILVMLRLSWRLGNPSPELPGALLAWQRFVARVTHIALYALLILFPLSGWAALSAYDGDFPIYFFAWDNVFRLVPQATPGSPFNSDLYGEIHETCWKIGAVILLLHISAALWHEYIRRDGALSRMWRG